MKKFSSAFFKWEVKIIIIICLSFSFAGFIGMLFMDINVWIAFGISVCFCLIVSPFLFLPALLDEHFLKNGVKSKGFQPLISNGFRLITHRKIAALAGEYRGYHFDIYYSRHIHVKNIIAVKHYGGYVFIVYHQPITYRRELQLDEKYYRALFSNRAYDFYWSKNYVRMETSMGALAPNYRKIKRRMDAIVNILVNENILPNQKGLEGKKSKL